MLGHKHCPACGEGGIEVVVEELSTRMVQLGHQVTCYNRSGHYVSDEEFDGHDRQKLKKYKGVKLKSVFTINHKGYAAMSSFISAAIRAVFGNYNVVRIHAEGPTVMSWLPKLIGKRVMVTIYGDGVIKSTKSATLLFSRITF